MACERSECLLIATNPWDHYQMSCPERHSNDKTYQKRTHWNSIYAYNWLTGYRERLFIFDIVQSNRTLLCPDNIFWRTMYVIIRKRRDLCLRITQSCSYWISQDCDWHLNRSQGEGHVYLEWYIRHYRLFFDPDHFCQQSYLALWLTENLEYERGWQDCGISWHLICPLIDSSVLRSISREL